jgi:hypothetical protein
MTTGFDADKARSRRYAATIIVACLMAVLVYSIRNSVLEGPVSDMSQMVFSLFSAVVAFSAVHHYGSKGKMPLCFVLFAAGLSLWFLGQTSWALYRELFGIDVPYPSIADLFWLIGYPLIILGLVSYYRLFVAASSLRRMILAGLTSLVFIAVIVTFVVVPSIDLTGDMVTSIVNVLYPTLDVSMLFAALMLLMLTKGGRISIVWYFIAVASMLNAVGDILFSYAIAAELFGVGFLFSGLIGLLYIYAYILFGLGIYEHNAML